MVAELRRKMRWEFPPEEVEGKGWRARHRIHIVVLLFYDIPGRLQWGAEVTGGV